MNNQIIQDGQNNPSGEPQSESKLAAQTKTKQIKTHLISEGKPNDEEDRIYEQVKQSRFKQQNLPAWRPVPTILSIVIVFAVFGILFIVLGIVLLVYSNKVHSAELDYTDCALDTSCTKSLTLEEDIDSPVFVYYQLNGFFQNSRRYVKSKETDQLTGDDINAHDNCEPAEKNSEMGLPYGATAIDDSHSTLPDNNIAVPCGLIAKTYFNDTFTFKIGLDNVDIDQSNIAFAKDKDLYDKNPDITKQWTDITDEHFLVWMRPSGLPNPKKLWGRINRDLKQGETIEININNRYNVTHFGGKKKIVLSNATKFGGKNKFLGISYIVVGAISIICAIVFPIGYKYQQNKEKNL
jgi:preprotein translocase subunit SecG